MRTESLRKIPRDWESLAFADVADINPESLGVTTPAGLVFRYVDLSAVERGRVDWSAVREMRFQEAPSRARRIVRSGDILFGTVRPVL